MKRRRRKKTWEDYVESPVGTNKNHNNSTTQHVKDTVNSKGESVFILFKIIFIS